MKLVYFSNTGLIRDDPYRTSRKNSLELIELSSINRGSLVQVSSWSNTGSIRDDPYWTSRKNSLELIESSNINKVSLFKVPFCRKRWIKSKLWMTCFNRASPNFYALFQKINSDHIYPLMFKFTHYNCRTKRSRRIHRTPCISNLKCQKVINML